MLWILVRDRSCWFPKHRSDLVGSRHISSQIRRFSFSLTNTLATVFLVARVVSTLWRSEGEIKKKQQWFRISYDFDVIFFVRIKKIVHSWLPTGIEMPARPFVISRGGRRRRLKISERETIVSSFRTRTAKYCSDNWLWKKFGYLFKANWYPCVYLYTHVFMDIFQYVRELGPTAARARRAHKTHTPIYLFLSPNSLSLPRSFP